MKAGVKKDFLEIILNALWEGVQTYGPKVWKNIKAYWDRKNVAILGITGCGKDSLLARLQGRDIPAYHINTDEAERRSSFQIEYNDGLGGVICFNITEGMNVGGEAEHVDDFWADATKDADVIFYMVDIGKFLNEIEHIPTDLSTMDEKSLRKASPSLKRLSDDMRFLVTHPLSAKPSAKLAIILNKIDLPLEPMEGDTIDEKIQHYSQDLQRLRTTIAKIAKSGLGVHESHLTGVFPLSCKNPEMFAQLFPIILRNVAKA